MALVQSGWVDLTNTGLGGISGSPGEYWIITSESQNQHVGRDGVIRGAVLRLSLLGTPLDGIYFCALRLVSGTNYVVVGKSEEITAGFAGGLNTFTFTQPIRGVRSSDLFAIGYKVNDTTNIMRNKRAGEGGYVIDDTATAKIRWHDSGSADYAAVAAGSTIALAGGGNAWGVIDMVPLMDPPMVAVVGDSISEGSPINRSYRNNATAKSRTGAFAARLFRDKIGSPVEISGNVETSNNAANVLALDLEATFWAKTPRVVYCHVGINDLAEGRTYADYEGNLDSILAECTANNAALVIDDLFPWTGNASNTVGKHAQNVAREAWNASKAAWALANGVRFIRASHALGKERTVAKTGDPAPIAGNLWDLVTAYDAADNLGVHLSEAGCEAAAAILAPQLPVIQTTATTLHDLYCVIYNAAGEAWNRIAFETEDLDNWADYAWHLAETPEGSGVYRGLFPPSILTPAHYTVEIYDRAAAVPATTDTLLTTLDYYPSLPDLPAASDVRVAVDRGDGVLGTMPATYLVLQAS